MNSDELLTAFEECHRKAFWSRIWEKNKITTYQLLQAGIKDGLLTDREDFGECAGECVMGISAQREIVSDQHDIYSEVIHHASLADISCSAIRKRTDKPWLLPEPTTLPGGAQWASSVFLAPSSASLRRVVLVSNWGTDKHYSFCRSWETIGNICAYSLPMQMAVIVLGQHRDGKRHGPLSKGLRHPVNKGLRFRKRTDISSGFKSTWRQVWREDFDEISTIDWLQAMHTDGVLSDVCFSVNVDVPDEKARTHVLDLASRKLERLEQMKEVPDEQFTGCSWPTKCQYINPCHAGEQSPNGKYGFVKIT